MYYVGVTPSVSLICKPHLRTPFAHRPVHPSSCVRLVFLLLAASLLTSKLCGVWGLYGSIFSFLFHLPSPYLNSTQPTNITSLPRTPSFPRCGTSTPPYCKLLSSPLLSSTLHYPTH